MTPLLRSLVGAETRVWLGRVLLSLAIAALAGALAYLVTRAVTSVTLFVQQQQFLREVAGSLRGGVLGLANGDLRAARLLVQQLDAQYEQLSLTVGFVVAALAAVLSYVWLEQRAARSTAARRR